MQQPYEFFILSVSAEGIAVDLKIYPNPVQKEIRLDLGTLNPEGISYQLFDINGRALEYALVSSAIEQIDMNYLSAGVYILNVSKEGKTIKSFKISKF